MDDNKDNKVKDAKSKDSLSAVMDVKPPKTVDETKPSTDSSLPDWPTEDEDKSDTKSETSETSSPEPDAAPEAKSESDDSSDKDKAENPMAITAEPSKKKTNLTVIIALVVFILLVVAAYFAYTNNKKTNPTVAKTQTTSKAQPADVDQTTSDVDKSLDSANDDSDFASTDLSDSSLGL